MKWQTIKKNVFKATAPLLAIVLVACQSNFTEVYSETLPLGNPEIVATGAGTGTTEPTPTPIAPTDSISPRLGGWGITETDPDTREIQDAIDAAMGNLGPDLEVVLESGRTYNVTSLDIPESVTLTGGDGTVIQLIPDTTDNGATRLSGIYVQGDGVYVKNLTIKGFNSTATSSSDITNGSVGIKVTGSNAYIENVNFEMGDIGKNNRQGTINAVGVYSTGSNTTINSCTFNESNANSSIVFNGVTTGTVTDNTFNVTLGDREASYAVYLKDSNVTSIKNNNFNYGDAFTKTPVPAIAQANETGSYTAMTTNEISGNTIGVDKTEAYNFYTSNVKMPRGLSSTTGSELYFGTPLVVNGTLKDQFDRPIPNKTLTATESTDVKNNSSISAASIYKTAKTNDKGEFSFEVYANGEYNLVQDNTSKKYYLEYGTAIFNTDIITKDAIIPLVNTAESVVIKGYVRDNLKAPLKGIYVDARSEMADIGKLLQRVETDENGIYTFIFPMPYGDNPYISQAPKDEQITKEQIVKWDDRIVRLDLTQIVAMEPNEYTSFVNERPATPGVTIGDVTLNEMTVGDAMITGTGDGGAIITILINGTPYTTTADGGGNWTLDLGGNGVVLKDGDFVSVSQQKTGSPVSASVTDYVIAAPPVIEALIAGDDVVKGTATPGNVVTVTFQNGVKAVSEPADADGNWTVNVPSNVVLVEKEKVTATQYNEKSGKTSKPGEMVVGTIAKSVFITVPETVTIDVMDTQFTTRATLASIIALMVKTTEYKLDPAYIITTTEANFSELVFPDVVGDYPVKLKVASKAKTSGADPQAAIFKVLVRDRTKPVINVGANTLNFGINSVISQSYFLGVDGINANVTDNYDKTPINATVGGYDGVKFDTLGAYNVTLNAKDVAGNAADPVVVTVNVTQDAPTTTPNARPDTIIDTPATAITETPTAETTQDVPDQIIPLANGYTAVQTAENPPTFDLFDENGGPLGSVIIPEGKSIETMDLDELLPLANLGALKANPITGESALPIGVMATVLGFAIMGLVSYKKRCVNFK